MQVTIDSDEPLERVLRVVGALYGVELTVALPTEGAAGAAGAPAEAAPRPARAGTRPRRSGAAGGVRSTPAGRRGARKPSEVDRAAVRDWARAHGYEVRDRGRVPNAVLTAYRESTSG